MLARQAQPERIQAISSLLMLSYIRSAALARSLTRLNFSPFDYRAVTSRCRASALAGLRRHEKYLPVSVVVVVLGKCTTYKEDTAVREFAGVFLAMLTENNFRGYYIMLFVYVVRLYNFESGALDSLDSG